MVLQEMWKNKFLLCYSILQTLVCATVINKDIQRTVDASSSMVKIITEIRATGVVSEYIFCFPKAQAEHLAYISVTNKGKQLEITKSSR